MEQVKQRTMTKPIRTEEAYEQALEEINDLWDSDRQDEMDRLEVLAILVENYESDYLKSQLPHDVWALGDELLLAKMNLETIIEQVERVDIQDEVKATLLFLAKSALVEVDKCCEVIIGEKVMKLLQRVVKK